MRKLGVEQELFRLFGLTADQINRVMSEALKGCPQGSYCDIYFQSGSSESIYWDQGHLKQASQDIVSGAGLRIVIGDKMGFSFCDQVNISQLRKCARTARAIAQFTTGAFPQPLAAPALRHNLYPVQNSPTNASLSARISLVKRIDKEARSIDPKIENASIYIAAEDYDIIIANSLGQLMHDKRPLVYLNIDCNAVDGKRRESGSFGGGGRWSFEALEDDKIWKKFARQAAESAVASLQAKPAPSGEMTVVLGSGWPGVLVHEAVGHGLEGDFNRIGSSVFSKMIGQQVASPLVTIIDDGTMASRRGSLNFDDEGCPTSQTVLIENGILKGYLQDRQNSQLMGTAMTGNGRRQSYRHPPMPRMTNTFMASGRSTKDEIIASVKRGIYAETFGGGQVDITNGNFSFTATAAWYIEDGKLKYPVKGATLIGNGPKAMCNVSMVGNDSEIDLGIGNCGKNGQSVPVGVGMPSVRIDNVTVGGSSN